MQHHNDTDTSGTADELHAVLATMEARGADRFDPVRFRYIQTMATRSLQQDTTVANLVVKKAWEALQAYQSGLSKERAQAQILLKKLVLQDPQMTKQLEHLFEACQFKEIKRLAESPQQLEQIDTFVALTHRLHDSANDADGLAASGPQELKALQYFRDALQQQHAEQLVSSALMDAPESAGPLNPQKLALRSLAIMREVSPAYLGHFVSYVDTLFWLERLDVESPKK